MSNLTVKVGDVSGYQDANVHGLAGEGFAGIVVKVTEDMSGAGGQNAQAQAASARAVGMAVIGGYDFAGGSDGTAQCDNLIDSLGTINPARLVCDAEQPDVSITIVRQFGVRAHEWNPNIKPLLYASVSFVEEFYSGADDLPALYDLWEAAYTAGDQVITEPQTPPPATPEPFTTAIGWQFTSHYPSSLGLIDASMFDPAILTGGDTPPVPPHTGDDNEMVIFKLTDEHDHVTYYRDAAGILVALDDTTAAEFYPHVEAGRIPVVTLAGLNGVLDYNKATIDAHHAAYGATATT